MVLRERLKQRDNYKGKIQALLRKTLLCSEANNKRTCTSVQIWLLSCLNMFSYRANGFCAPHLSKCLSHMSIHIPFVVWLSVTPVSVLILLFTSTVLLYQIYYVPCQPHNSLSIKAHFPITHFCTQSHIFSKLKESIEQMYTFIKSLMASSHSYPQSATI